MEKWWRYFLVRNLAFRSLKINKKSIKPSTFSVYGIVCKQRQFICFCSWALQGEKPSTALAHKAFSNAGLIDKKVTLFLHREDFTHWASMNNLNYVQVLTFDDVNAYATFFKEIASLCCKKMLACLKIWWQNGIKYLRYHSWSGSF